MNLLVETAIGCPHCGANFETMVDTSQQSYSTVEDCAVCCRPIRLDVTCEPGEVLGINASAEMS